MVRTKDPAVRTLLIERAAHMLRTREPITLRSLVAGTGVSTMAVYTHFGGMDGMWEALRQEGFTRLAARYATLATTDDPVEDLTALVAVYLVNALDHPDLYRVMFDASFELADLRAANATLEYLDRAADRGRGVGRLRAETAPRELAVQSWTVAHGLASLVANGPLPRHALANGVTLLTALYIGTGDDPDRCRRSVENGWRRLEEPRA
ncbi:TetR family transcriptional regulator [Nocardiopsis sp. CNR-923]|uniref:TetR/AcrR family transcriptional regulator n=1 Tax=Nocardiopsis sp. CNR-923 TaxID=1904965 RepID=UPI00095D18B3|nr:TetR/AcrR family transcriptional regulator [Nocardiopsis sp. CNR-923]OLT27553.1 TetR family transcriptional regulator [Nocardiopsis sp. CNR-923]